MFKPKTEEQLKVIREKKMKRAVSRGIRSAKSDIRSDQRQGKRDIFLRTNYLMSFDLSKVEEDSVREKVEQHFKATGYWETKREFSGFSNQWYTLLNVKQVN